MIDKELSCPICNGLGNLIHKGTRDNRLIDVYKCQKCGTKFLSKLERKNDYENGFMYGSQDLNNINIQERLKVFRPDDMRRCEMVKEICCGKSILDFGCGFGGFLDCISKVSSSCMGIELGKTERNYLNKKGIKCLKTIEECKELFDVITLFHVFEHLSDPRVWLIKLSEYLKDGGYLVIEVPNANDILLSLYDCRSFADFTYWSAHLYLYTIQSLTILIEGSERYDIASADQVQRYSIANHLMWLAKNEEGGHNKWKFLESKELNEAYLKKLHELQMCDTLFFVLKKK